MRSVFFTVLLCLGLSPALGHAQSAKGENEFACAQASQCLSTLPRLPLSPTETKTLTRLTIEFERLRELSGKGKTAPALAQSQDHELGSAADRYLRLASDCRDISDDHACRKPLAWVQDVVDSVDFRDGLSATEFPRGAPQTWRSREWSDASRDVARRWIKDVLCQSSLSKAELEGFRGFVLYGSSCFRHEDLTSWFDNIFAAKKDPVCQNIIYNGTDKKVYIAGDFILNARLWTESGVADASVRLFEHEMAHHRHFNLPNGEKELEEFAALRIHKILPVYRAEVAALAEKHFGLNRPGGPDLKGFEEAWTELAKRHHIPMRWGPGTDVRLVASLAEVNAVTRDLHSIDNDFEYFAVALELYRHDRKRALETYSKEELEWLARHCRS